MKKVFLDSLGTLKSPLMSTQNLRAFRNRGVLTGQRVFAYRNLHRECWSLKALDGPFRGKVIAHADAIGLHTAAFMVNETGRQRVIKNRRKNVHAGIIATIAIDMTYEGYMPTIHYNPYQCGDFIHGVNGDVVLSALYVHLGDDGAARGAGIVTRGLRAATEKDDYGWAV